MASSSNDLHKELKQYFPELKDDEKLLVECASICHNYNLSAERLFYEWEAKRYKYYGKSRGLDQQVLTLAAIDDIKKTLVDSLTKKRPIKGSSSLSRAYFIRSNPSNPTSSMNVKSANNGAQARPTAKTMAPSVVFKGPTGDKKDRRYRYMYEKTSKRSDILDERIDEFAELIRGYYNPDELADPAATSNDDVIVVGRVCNDADLASDGSSKLNEGSIFIESSRIMGSGRRVALRFSPDLKLRKTVQGAGGLGLFPGAIATLKGKNGGGSYFIVNELLGLPPLLVLAEPLRHKQFSMAVVCGPYTSETDLSYARLSQLMGDLSQSRPSVLLLLGPFVDSAHPIIKSGEIDQLPSEMFLENIVEPLISFLDASPESLVLIQPSVRDMLSDHPVYPQCELENTFTNDPRVKMIPNPCRFSVNDVTFASTSVDVLLHLRGQEHIFRGQEVDPIPPTSSASSATDTFTNACRHLLQQRSFYPIFPVPADHSSEVNLDVSHSDGLRLNPSAEDCVPDVLILPSKFKQFTKLVDATWAVNPSSISKGSYVLIDVPETSRADLKARMKCETIKI